ncbi:MAG: NAD(P)-binding domain-containing protein [Saprospiraceae bacterium]
MKVAIIGAGCSGIAAVKELSQAGIQDIVCYEQNDRVGGNWIYSPSPSHSSVTRTTHIISSKKLSEYRDYPMPDDYPDYPSHSQVLAYFDGYADHFGVKPFIRFNTKVTRVVKSEFGQFLLWVDGATEAETFDYLIVSNGHHSVPRHIELPGHFSGEYLHAHDFKTNDRFVDRRILVIGGGNSACDCAVECSRVAAHVSISMRRPQYIVPKFMMGRPSDTFNDTLKYVPGRLAEKIRKISLALQIGSYESYGLRTPDFPITKDHPTVNSELLYMLRHGKVTPRVGISKVEDFTITFRDGTSGTFDTIIAATGYKMATPFFEPDFLDYSDADRVELYLRMFHPVHQQLIFVGLVQPQGSVWPLSEVQSKLAANYILGKYTLPDDIQSLAESEATKISSDFIPHKRHTVEVHFKPYIARLQAELNKIAK